MTHMQVATPSVELSIIIKTLNEEKNIARCIETILDSIDDIAFEIIVADSGSADRTIEIATSYPVTVVQLANPAERSCGIGPQLGFQHSHGDFVLILDADMLLHADFVRSALARMKGDSRCAGIGGQLRECSGTGYEYDLRRSLSHLNEESVRWLDGGGLYRRTAIQDVGYLSNRNLHAYEEKELGLRLIYANWHLVRTAELAVDHYGHSVDTVKLLWKRWRSGYADACGESIRASFGKPYLYPMALVHKALILCLVLQFSLLACIAMVPWSFKPVLIFSIVTVAGLGLQTYRKKSVSNAVHSLLHLNVFSVGLLIGLMKSQINPMQPVQSVVYRLSNIFDLQAPIWVKKNDF